ALAAVGDRRRWAAAVHDFALALDDRRRCVLLGGLRRALGLLPGHVPCAAKLRHFLRGEGGASGPRGKVVAHDRRPLESWWFGQPPCWVAIRLSRFGACAV